jgi:hypothetical protein
LSVNFAKVGLLGRQRRNTRNDSRSLRRKFGRKCSRLFMRKSGCSASLWQRCRVRRFAQRVRKRRDAQPHVVWQAPDPSGPKVGEQPFRCD